MTYDKITITQVLKEIFQPFTAVNGRSTTYAEEIDACAEQWYIWKDTDTELAKDYRKKVRDLLWKCLGSTERYEARTMYFLYTDVWVAAVSFIEHYTSYKLPCEPGDILPNAKPFEPTNYKFSVKFYEDLVSRFYDYYMQSFGARKIADSDGKKYWELPKSPSDFYWGDCEDFNEWENTIAAIAVRDSENEHLSDPEKLALDELEQDRMTAAMYNLMLTMINLWDHLPLRQRSKEKAGYYRTFYADTISQTCHGVKAQAHMARCREHEDELFRAMEVLFLDFTLFESCKTIDQLMQSHYKPYSQLTDKKVEVSTNGYTPNAIFQAFYNRVKAKTLAVSTLSEQRDSYKKFIWKNMNKAPNEV